MKPDYFETLSEQLKAVKCLLKLWKIKPKPNTDYKKEKLKWKKKEF